jgi:hypothetical protein
MLRNMGLDGCEGVQHSLCKTISATWLFHWVELGLQKCCRPARHSFGGGV